MKHHGFLNEPLCTAFIDRRDTRLARCVRKCATQFIHEGYQRPRSSNHVAWHLACGLSLEYVDIAMDFFFSHGGGNHNVLEHACLLGDIDHVQKVASHLDFAWPVDQDLANWCAYSTERTGNFALLNELPLEPQAKFDRLFLSRHVESMRFAFDTWPELFRAFVASRQYEQRIPVLLEAWQLVASERQRQCLPADWERVYVTCMGNTNVAMQPILEWMEPLARRQFEARQTLDRHAVPLFMTALVRDSLRRAQLMEWGLEHETSDRQWDAFPYVQDQRHYMYRGSRRTWVAVGHDADVMAVAASTTTTTRKVSDTGAQ
jgi:hypothetical protein